MSIYSIYKATNIIDGKVYIGFDSHWPNRKGQHLILSQKGSGWLFHEAIRKYGPDAFEWEVICQSKDGHYLLNEMEPYFIKEYNSFYLNGQGYNMTLGGDGTVGYHHLEETKTRISNTKRGYRHSEKSKNKMSESRKNRPLSEKERQHLDKLHESRKGCKHTTETKKKMSNASKGRRHSEQSKEKMSESHKGCIPWNKGTKGKQICSDETRKKMSISRIGNKNRLGKIHSLEDRKKISDGLKKRKMMLSSSYEEK